MPFDTYNKSRPMGQYLMYSKELRNINCLILFIAYKVKISFKLKSQAFDLAGMRRGL